MSEWNIITDVVGRALSVVAMGPAGLGLNPVGTGWELAGDLFGPAPDKVVPAKAAPYPGTSPEGEPPPGMEWPKPGAPPGAPPPPPPPPPNGPDGSSGEAAEAASADAADVNRLMMELHELDKRAAETADAVHASNELVKKTMEDIARDVDAKMTAMGDRVNTPEGQKELRDYLKERLQTAKEVLTNAVSYAEECARKTQEITQSYSDVGGGKGGPDAGGGGGSDTGGSGGGGGGGDTGGGGGGGEPTTPPGTQPASTTPAGMPMGMPGGMMPGMGGMPSLPSLPSFGGGGMPGMSDPLGALGGLGSGAPGGQAPGMHDETAGSEDPKAPEGPKVHDDATAPGDTSGSGEAGKTDEAGTVPAAHETDSKGSDDAATQPAGNSVPGQTAGADPADATSGTSVKLPSGVISEARNDAGATAVRAALDGDTVEQAYRKADISVPPPGTPVTDPVPPTLLKAGDIGIWKDHLVMALGNGKVLVSGQEQPLDSVGSGPDFMGWLDPTKQHASGQGQGQAVQSPDPGSTGA